MVIYYEYFKFDGKYQLLLVAIFKPKVATCPSDASRLFNADLHNMQKKNVILDKYLLPKLVTQKLLTGLDS